MTNLLFLEVLNGRIALPPKTKPPAPVQLDEWQVQALRNMWGSDAFQDAIEQLAKAGIITLPLPTEPRARALAAKQRRGKGPQQTPSWRGNERNSKYRTQ